MSGDEIVGHKTFGDGHGGFRHEPLTRSEADGIWEAIEARRARGFKQRIKVRHVPKKEIYSLDGGRTLIMHPLWEIEIKRIMAAQMERRMDAMAMEAFMDNPIPEMKEADL